jgi:1-acyl-sn-glycerol-3-phosphate acyltransferase
VILLRSVLFNILFYAGTALACALVLPLTLGRRSRALAAMRAWGRASVWLLRVVCGTRVVVEGAERLPTGGAALIAAKHQSAFDTVVWFALLPRVAYVLKAELLRLPLYGRLAKAAGHIVVDRDAGAKTMRGLLRDGKAAAAEERQVVIFPEGTRMAPGATVPFQPGVAALAAVMAVPVIPVATNAGLFWGREAFLKRPGTLRIVVLEPLPAGLPKDTLLRELEARIAAEQERLGA